MNYHKSEKGQALILIVFAIFGLIGLTALAVDGGNAYSDRRHAQNAADTASLAAALAKIRNQDFNTAAFNSADSNGYDNNATTTVDVNNPPGPGCNGQNGHYAGDADYIQVLIHSTVDTYFGPVIGVEQVHNCVESIAHAKPQETAPIYDGFSIVGLQPSGCNSVYISGNAQVQTWGGGIHSNSSDTCGLHFQGSSESQTHEGSGGFSMVGNGYQITGRPSIQDHGQGFHYNQPQLPYPPTNLPDPVCTKNAAVYGSQMTAGTFTGSVFPPSGVNNLKSGVYCITNGNFKLNGNAKLSGTEVTIVLMTGSIDWNGSAEIKLTAPTSGALKGLLIFAPITNHNLMKINGNSNSDLVGTILLPGADIRINGNNSQLQKTDSKIIGYTVELSGSSDTQIEMQTSSQYEATDAPEIELAE